MRYIHYLLFCFTLLFVQGAHAFYCIETINGTEYPTLYAVSGETWADVEKREGCTFIEFKLKNTDRNFEKFTKSSKTYSVNTRYPVVKMKLSDGTVVEITNIVLFDGGSSASLHYLNSEAKFENINNDANSLMPAKEEYYLYEGYLNGHTETGVDTKARYVEMPAKFTKPIYVEERQDDVRLPGFTMRATKGGDPERLHDLLDFVWAPLGTAEDSIAAGDVNIISYEVRASDGSGYAKGIYISPDELNKLPKKGAFALYAILKGSANDYIYMGWFPFTRMYCIDKADAFTTLPSWEGDHLYSSDFIATIPLSKVENGNALPGYDGALGGVGWQGDSISKISYSSKNLVEILDPNTGDVLESFTFESLDSGKIVAHAFSNKTTPGSDYIAEMDVVYDSEQGFSTRITNDHALYGKTPISFDEYKALLLNKRYKGWTTFRVKSPDGAILSSGIITVNSLMGVLCEGYGNGLVDIKNAIGTKLLWEVTSDSRELSFNRLWYAFDPNRYIGKYNFFWDVTLNTGDRFSLSEFGNYAESDKEYFWMTFTQPWTADFKDNISTMDLFSSISGGIVNFRIERRGNDSKCEMISLSANAYVDDIINADNDFLGTLSRVLGIEDPYDILKSYAAIQSTYSFKDNKTLHYNALGEVIEDLFGVNLASSNFELNLSYGDGSLYFHDPIFKFEAWNGQRWLWSPGHPDDIDPTEYIPNVYKFVEELVNESGYSQYPYEVDISYLDKFNAAYDYMVLRHLPLKGMHDSLSYITLRKVACSVHTDCIATVLVVDNGAAGGIYYTWPAVTPSIDITQNTLVNYSIYATSSSGNGWGGTVNVGSAANYSDLVYYIGCEKGGFYIDEDCTAEELRCAPDNILENSDVEKVPFSLAYPFNIEKLDLPSQLFGVYGFLGAQRAYVFEGDDWANFLYDNLSISIGSSGSYGYNIPAINASGENYIASGGKLWSGFNLYLMNQHQVDSGNPYYDEEFRNVIEGTGADTYRQSPVYAYLGTINGLYQLGVTPGYNYGNGYDPIVSDNPISNIQFTAAGFWNLKSLGFRETGDLWCAIGTFESNFKHNTFFPVRVNGFKRNLYTTDDLSVHRNLSGVNNSNDGSPDIYALTENASGMYTIYDMLAFDQGYYNSNVYKVKWLIHYTDVNGDRKVITASDAETKFGIKFTEYPWSKLVRLDIDCSNSSTDIEELTVQPVIYRVLQRFGNSKGNGFTDWQIVDSDDWVPSNTVDAAHSSIGRAATGAVISSLGNLWSFKVRTTPVCQERDLILWSFLKDPAVSLTNVTYLLSKLKSKYSFSDVTITTSNWGTSNATYTIMDLKGHELYKGKITYVSQPTKGIASDGTYYWDFSPELPEYLKDDLRLVYTHSGIGSFARFDVLSVDNGSRVTLSGISDSVFLAADASVISALKSGTEFTGISACYPNYIPATGKDWLNTNGALKLDTVSSNVWYISAQLDNVYKWEGDTISDDELRDLGTVTNQETGEKYSPGSELSRGVYDAENLSTGEKTVIYVNGVYRINDENIFTKAGGSASSIDFGFRHTAYMDDKGGFKWFGISGAFGGRHFGEEFIPFPEISASNMYIVSEYPTAGQANKVGFALSGVKSAANASNILAMVGTKASENEMYYLWVQPDAILKLELIRIDDE